MTEPRPTSSSGSNYVFLIAAVVIGIVATVVAYFFLDNYSKKEQELKRIQILVASHNISNGSPLDTNKDLSPIDLPSTPETKKLALLGFTPEAPPPNRQRVNRPIPAGSLILKSDLGGTADFEFSNLPRGSTETQNAMSIPVQGANALSGLLVPGDMVKIMITKPGATSAESFGAGQKAPSGYTTTVLFKKKKDDPNDKGTAVRVLAVGSRFTRSRQEMLTSGVYEAQRESENVKTVTVEVNDEQASELLRETGGNIWPVTLILPRKPE